MLGGWRAQVAVVAASLLLTAGVDDLVELFDEIDELEDTAEATTDELDDLDDALERQREELVERTEQLEEAESRLEAVENHLELVEQELEEAEARHEEAEQAHREAQETLAETTEELERAEEAFVEQVRDVYTGRSVDELALVEMAFSEDSIGDVIHDWERLTRAGERQNLEVEDLVELQRRHQLARARAEHAEDQRDEERRAAQRARDSVAELREERAERREDLAEQRERQAELVAEIESDREAAERLLAHVRADIDAAREEAEQVVGQVGGSGDGGLVCPVPGASFVDDWHYPRSGGRLHKGNDLFADRGTPVLAPADGTVRRRDDVDRWSPGSGRDLGGKTVSITTEPGTWWYFAHLDEIADDVRPGDAVHAGQVIGTVGNTGNARHTPPHLHLGYYPGGEAQNPYPLIDPACRR